MRGKSLFLLFLFLAVASLLVVLVFQPGHDDKWAARTKQIDEMKSKAKANTLPHSMFQGEPTPGNAWDEYDIARKVLKSYVDVYLREEIREEQIVRQLDPFARFLEAAAQSSGTIVNLARIGREAGTDAKAVSRYFQILEDTLIGFFLDPYHRSVRKRQRQQAKFFLFDIGVRRALEGTLHQTPRPGTYEWGRSFEELVVLEAIRLNSYLRCGFRFSYLRTQSQMEVDLIAERRGSATWVVEIKSGTDPDPTDLRKLRVLAADIPDARPAIFCAAEHPKIVDDVEVLPWRTGLERMFMEPER